MSPRYNRGWREWKRREERDVAWEEGGGSDGGEGGEVVMVGKGWGEGGGGGGGGEYMSCEDNRLARNELRHNIFEYR